ncbi:MAG: hypothetical protein GX594_04785 [Pirellulaceae bacterium]|nr:hypothetical protein [Pirellulaceae bacterium]
MIDEFAVFNKALPAETIRQLYYGGPPPADEPKTTAEEKGGQSMIDP